MGDFGFVDGAGVVGGGGGGGGGSGMVAAAEGEREGAEWCSWSNGRGRDALVDELAYAAR